MTRRSFFSLRERGRFSRDKFPRNEEDIHQFISGDNSPTHLLGQNQMKKKNCLIKWLKVGQNFSDIINVMMIVYQMFYLFTQLINFKL
jgi:hypothetical protein